MSKTKYFIAQGCRLLSNGLRASMDYSEVSPEEWEISKSVLLQENASFTLFPVEDVRGLHVEYYYSIYNDFEEIDDQYFGYTLELV